MPSNLIGSAPIAFNICAILNTDVLYLQFFRKTEVLRGVCRLVRCLKISGEMFSFGKHMNYNEKPEAFAGTTMIFPRIEGFPKCLSSGTFY